VKVSGVEVGMLREVGGWKRCGLSRSSWTGEETSDFFTTSTQAISLSG
jgi:hypothetical protein